MSFIRKPSNSPYYYYYWSEGGQQKSESLKTDVLDVAKIKAARKDEARMFGASNLPDINKPWTELKEEFLWTYAEGRTKDLYEQTIGEFEAAVKPVRACISSKDAEGFIQKLRQEKRKRTGAPLGPVAINIRIRNMRAIFNYALEKKYITENPFSKIKQEREKEKLHPFLHASEAQRLIEVSRDSWCPDANLLVLAYLYTGLRLSEVVQMRWESVDFEFNRIGFVSPKTGKAKYVMLHPALRAALLERTDRAGYVFKGRSGDRPRCRFATGRLFNKLYKRAGIKNVGGLHVLRHTFLTYLAPLMAIQDLQNAAGHTNIRTTQRYLHPTPEQRQQFARLSYGVPAEAKECVELGAGI